MKESPLFPITQSGGCWSIDACKLQTSEISYWGKLPCCASIFKCNSTKETLDFLIKSLLFSKGQIKMGNFLGHAVLLHGAVLWGRNSRAQNIGILSEDSIWPLCEQVFCKNLGLRKSAGGPCQAQIWFFFLIPVMSAGSVWRSAVIPGSLWMNSRPPALESAQADCFWRF